MEANVKIGRILGIPVGLHWSWFLVFVLVTSSLAAGYFPAEYPELSVVTYWLLGVITSVLFFGSVLMHELGHAVVALRNNIPVRGISLFVFGGVAEIAQEPRTPGAEFRIAMAGPLVSFALAILFGALWLVDQGISMLAAPSIWLARINLLLAVFNLIPGFPLDGGRVLRAAVWAITKSLRRATQIATMSGQLVAFGFIGVGLLTVLNGNVVNGIWFVFIGWFLQNAAASAMTQNNVQTALQGVTVEQVMDREQPRVPSWLSLENLVTTYVLPSGNQSFLVADNGKTDGLLTLRDVTSVPRDNWPMTTTAQVMMPWERLIRVQPASDLLAALRLMDEAGVAQVPVVNEHDEVVGILSRQRVLHYIRTRAELGL